MEVDGYMNEIPIPIKVIQELNYKLDSKSTILDFGCGNGYLVRKVRKLGYRAYGCDIDIGDGLDVDLMKNEGVIRLINSENYRIPFDDNFFDFIFSDQVFEHVKDYSLAISEIERVLKPSGFSLHIFPSRYIFIEPHIWVPFGSVIQRRWWLSLWAKLGIRKKSQKNFGSKETTEQNYRYLHKYTNYLPKKEITQLFKEHFDNVKFCEKEYIKHHPRGKFLYCLSWLFPFLPITFSTFRSRAIFVNDPKKKLPKIL